MTKTKPVPKHTADKKQQVLAFTMVSGYLFALAISYISFTGDDGRSNTMTVAFSLIGMLCVVASACLSRLITGKIHTASKAVTFGVIAFLATAVSLSFCTVGMYLIAWSNL